MRAIWRVNRRLGSASWEGVSQEKSEFGANRQQAEFVAAMNRWKYRVAVLKIDETRQPFPIDQSGEERRCCCFGRNASRHKAHLARALQDIVLLAIFRKREGVW
jgi:hypothetical protein